MPISLIDKIKPKNGGTFAMADAEDVEYKGERLPYYLDKIGEGGGGGTDITVGETTVDALTFKSDPQTQLDALGEQIADLLYEAVAITSMSCSPSTAEKGSTVDAVTLTWACNKEPSLVMLDNATLYDDGALGASVTKSLTGLSLTENKTWTLMVQDERGAQATKSVTLSFLNGVYYGAAAAPGSIDSQFVLSLTKKLSSSKVRNFTADAGDGQYIWYCLPASMGECTFTVGGFEGGFDLVDTIAFTNASGYTDSYRVYKSANAGLGNTPVVVS